MSSNNRTEETIKKALLVPTVVFLAAVAVMLLGLFLVVVPITLIGPEEYKQFVRDSYAVVGTVSSVTLPFAVAFLLIKVSETD